MTCKKVSILILIMLVLLLLSSCGPYLSEGTIVSKEYRPRRVWISYIYVNKMLMPQTHVVPEAYIITIKGVVDGKEMTTTKSIPSYLYEKVSVGEWWKDDFLNGGQR